MRLEQSFDVKAPIARVWAALIDVEHVAPCLPGASVTGRADDGSYEGLFAVKIGPTSASYAGRLEMTEVDETAYTATMKADGTDRRGQGGASATIISRLTEVEPGATRVEVDTDYRITGRLARFGRGGMIEDISRKLLRQFATNLQASLDVVESAEAESVEGSGAEAAPPEPLPGGSAPAEPPTESAPAGSTAPVVNRHLRAAADADEVPFPGATPPPAAEPLDVGRLIGSTLIERARANPIVPIGVLLLLLLLLARRRRRG